MIRVIHIISHFLNNIVNKSQLKDERDKLRLSHFLWLITLGIISSLPFIVYNLYNNHYMLAFYVFIFTLSLMSSLFLAKREVNTYKLYNTMNTVYLLFALFLVYIDSTNEMRILWCYIYPISSIFLFGNKKGLIWSIVMIISAILLITLIPHKGADYSLIFIVRFTIVYICITFIASWLEYYKEMYYSQLRSSHNKLQHEHNLLIREINERKILQDKLSLMAHTDSLTNLLNRRYFWELGNKEIIRSKRYNFPVCLAILDVDHFKDINDTCGHPIGDEILRILARHCTYMLRENDILGRIGGEEFAFLLIHVGLSEAFTKLEILRQDIESLSIKSIENRAKLTVSIGVYELDAKNDTIDELYQKADEALYRAKQKGRNKVSN